MKNIINDSFNNYEKYELEKANLILTDIPYNIGLDAYASNPQWWEKGEVKNGKSELAKTKFFENEDNFSIDDFLKFCKSNLTPDGSVIVFCSFIQMYELIEKSKQYGFKKYIPLIFIKNYSAEVLKANMRIVGACEYGLQLIQEKLPPFYNNHKMIKNYFNLPKVNGKLHPNQKSVETLKEFITLFTKEGDVVIDCCAGSGSTLVACKELNRKYYGFEILEKYYNICIERLEHETKEN